MGDLFGDDWDGSLDDDLGDVTGGGGSNTYGDDGGDYSGGMSAGDNPQGESSSGGSTYQTKARYISPTEAAKSWTPDPAPVDPYTGNPQTDLWDESNMNLIPDPGQDPQSKIERASFWAKLLGILTGQPGLYMAGHAGKKMTDLGKFAGSILPNSNYLTPSMVPGTTQYAEAHPNEPSGGAGTGGGGNAGGGFAGMRGRLDQGQMSDEEMAAISAALQQQVMANSIASQLSTQQQGFGSLGALSRIPSGANLRRPRTTLFR